MKQLLKKLLSMALVLCVLLSVTACSTEETTDAKTAENVTAAPKEEENQNGETTVSPEDSDIPDSEEPTTEPTEAFAVDPIDCDVNMIAKNGKIVYLQRTLGDLIEQFIHDDEHRENFNYNYEETKSGTDNKIQGRKLLEERNELDEQLITEHTDFFRICDREGSLWMNIFFEENVGNLLMEDPIESYSLFTGSIFLLGNEYTIGETHVDELRELGLEEVETYSSDSDPAVAYRINGVFDTIRICYRKDSGTIWAVGIS